MSKKGYTKKQRSITGEGRSTRKREEERGCRVVYREYPWWLGGKEQCCGYLVIDKWWDKAEETRGEFGKRIEKCWFLLLAS